MIDELKRLQEQLESEAIRDDARAHAKRGFARRVANIIAREEGQPADMTNVDVSLLRRHRG
jgi:predicted RNA binding protein with dsRBD fold (UPF0201 family)